MRLIAALVLLFAIHAPAQTPAGWQVMKDRKQICQIALPADWTADKTMVSNVTAPDKKANVIFSSKPASASYADIVKMAEDMFKPVKTFEETAGRTWFASTPDRGRKGTAWYVAMSSSPVCEAQIVFEDLSFEASANQMVNSLKPVK
jgi:hypothetical protein